MSQGPRPMVMQILTQQNNSMHFNRGFGNSFSCQQKYQSDNEENTTSKQMIKGNHTRQGSDLQISLKKFQVPLSVAGGSAIGVISTQAEVKSNLTPVIVNVRASQSHNPNSSDGRGPIVSDHTSGSAGVVIISQHSLNTQKLSQDARVIEETPVKKFQGEPRQLIDMFKEDIEVLSSSPPQVRNFPPQIDETQTDLENGVQKKNLEQILVNTFLGLESMSEHHIKESQQMAVLDSSLHSSSIIDSYQQHQSQNISEPTALMKKDIMQRLKEMIDDDSDDQIVSKPISSDSDRFIEKNLNEGPSIKVSKVEESDIKRPFNTSAQSPSCSKPSARRNTRYGEAEDSLINFDLTSSKIIDPCDENSMIVLKKGQASKRDHRKTENADQTQRKSLIMQTQEQIQSIIQSEQSQFQVLCQIPPPRKTLLSEMEDENLPSVTLKSAFYDAGLLSQTASHQLTAEKEIAQVATSFMKLLDRKYNLTKILDSKFQAKGDVGQTNTGVKDISQDSILQDLDSISRIYNGLEVVLEEGESNSQMKTLIEESKGDVHNKSSERGRAGQFWSVTEQKESYNMPPLMRVNSEDEGEMPRSGSRRDKMKGLFYNRESSRHSDKGLQGQEETEAVPVSSPAWPLQLGRTDKHNRSTAMPLNTYQNSSDEEGKSAWRQTRQHNTLNKFLHNSVIGAPQQSPNTAKNGLQTQKTIKDVSFKSHNVSTHTDSAKRLTENIEMFKKNRLQKQQQNTGSKLETPESKR